MSELTTTRDLIAAAGQASWIAPYLVSLPVIAGLMGLVDGSGKKGPWPYLYSVLVYAACVPGILAAVLIAYMVGVARENLLDAPVVATVGPLLAMILTLGIVSRQVHFRDLPGVDRLWGLMLTLGMTFVFGLILTRTHFMVMFHGSFGHLIVTCIVIFLVLKLGLHLMFRRKDRPRRQPASW